MNLSNISKKLILLLLLMFGIGISIYAFIPKRNILDYIYDHFSEVYADYELDKYDYDHNGGTVERAILNDTNNDVKIKIEKVETFNGNSNNKNKTPTRYLTTKLEYKCAGYEYRMYMRYLLIDKKFPESRATKKMLGLGIDTDDPTFVNNQEERMVQAILLFNQYVTTPLQQLTNKFRHKVGSFNSIYIKVYPSKTCYAYENNSWTIEHSCPRVS